MNKVLITLIAVCTLSVAIQAATVTLYNDQALFEGALAATPQTITFTAAGYSDVSAGYTDSSGVSFAMLGDSMSIYITPPFTMGSGGVLVIPHGKDSMVTVTFPTAITAVGFNVMMAYGPDDFVVTYDAVLGAAPTSSALLMATKVWMGFTSDTPFTTFSISATSLDARGNIDNIEFGNATQVPVEDTPEIATMIMIGTGLLALRYGKRFIGPPLA